jgi:nucleoside-diphosphate-sugar epimerase
LRPALIVGCGYTGRRLAARLREDLRIPVIGTMRSERRAAELAAVGGEALVGDLTELEVLRRVGRLEPRLVFYLVPPDRSGRDPLPDLLRALELSGVEAFLYASSTSVYGDRGGDWVHEMTEPRPEGPAGEARYEAEQRVLGAMAVGLPARICRITGIYGPGRTLKGALENGDYVLIKDRDTWVNRIHVDDLVSGLIAVWTRGVNGEVYNLVDDKPHRASEFANLAAKLHGLPAPRWVEESEAREELGPQRLRRKLDSKRVSNRRLREDLRVTLEYPTYEIGLPAAIAAEGR